MSLYRLYNSAGVSIDFDDTSVFGVSYGSTLGVPRADRTFNKLFRRNHEPLSAVSYGDRQAELSLLFQGSNPTELSQTLNMVHNIIDDLEEYNESQGAYGHQTWLVVSPGSYSGSAVQYEVEAAELQDGGVFAQSVEESGVMPGVKLILWLQPFGRSQQLSLFSSRINSGAEVAIIDDIDGTRRAPVRLSYTPDAIDQVRRIIVGQRSRGNVSNFVPVLECEPGTDYANGTYDVVSIASSPVTLSGVANATAHGGSYAAIQTGSVVAESDFLRITIKRNLSDFFGVFRVFMRWKSNAGSYGGNDSYYGRLRFGASDGKAIPNSLVALYTASSAAPTYNGWLVADMGTIRIPYMSAFARGVVDQFSLVLSGYKTDTGAYATFSINIDALYLIPVDEGVMDVEFTHTLTGSSLTAERGSVVSDDLDFTLDVYALDSLGVNRQIRHSTYSHSGFYLRPGRGVSTVLVPLVLHNKGAELAANMPSGAYSHSLTGTGILQAEYYPTYDLLGE